MKEGDKYIGYVYKITSTANPNKCYIGQTSVTVNRRWTQHKSLAKSGKSQAHLYRAMNKYGQDTFSITTVDTIICSNKEELVEKLNLREKHFVELFDSLRNGWNSTSGGDSIDHLRGGTPWNKGKKLGPSWNKGLKMSEEARKNMSIAQKNRDRTNDKKRIIKNPELRSKRISEANKGKVPWNKGKVGVSPETSKKMSLSRIGKKQTDETILKRISKIKGKKRTEEQKLSSSIRNKLSPTIKIKNVSIRKMDPFIT